VTVTPLVAATLTAIEQRTIVLDNPFWETRPDQLGQARRWLEALR